MSLGGDKRPRVHEPNVRAVRQAAGAQMDVDQILLFWEIFVYVIYMYDNLLIMSWHHL